MRPGPEAPPGAQGRPRPAESGFDLAELCGVVIVVCLLVAFLGLTQLGDGRRARVLTVQGPDGLPVGCVYRAALAGRRLRPGYRLVVVENEWNCTGTVGAPVVADLNAVSDPAGVSG